MFGKLLKKPKQKKRLSKIIMRSNVIQYDEMGYPLRLVMIEQEDGTIDHVWRDTYYEGESDVVLRWEE